MREITFNDYYYLKADGYKIIPNILNIPTFNFENSLKSTYKSVEMCKIRVQLTSEKFDIVAVVK